MRTWAILTLLVAFATAVILPNDVGTDDMPATGAKHRVVKAGTHVIKPVKGGPVAWIVSIQQQATILVSSASPAVLYRSGETLARIQQSSPLLI